MTRVGSDGARLGIKGPAILIVTPIDWQMWQQRGYVSMMFYPSTGHYLWESKMRAAHN